MSTSLLKLAIFDAFLAELISCTEQRILAILAIADAPQSYQQLVTSTKLTRRTLARLLPSLATRGYVVRSVDNLWTLRPETLGVGSQDHTIAEACDPAITLGSTDPISMPAHDPPITPGSQDHPPAYGFPTPQTDPSRAYASARDLTSSSVMRVFNPDHVFDDPHEEEAARALVKRLGLTWRQARQGVRADADGVDIDGWLDWLARVPDPEPMRILVSRITHGECVPRIYTDRRPVAPAPTLPRQPTPAEMVEMQQRRMARRAARL